jgi:hypothetical protein
MSRAVFVLGMHRSGTSAVTRLLNLLGLPLAGDGDLLAADDANPAGYWESHTLKRLNDELLEAAGAGWTLPPPRPPRWDTPEVAEVADRAREILDDRFRTGGWVWKDPRNCVTLGFWVETFELEPAVVLVYRNPLEVAGSLTERDGFEKRRGLALWERYVRLSLASSAGLPTFVSAYADIVADPVRWAWEARSFLTWCGLELTAPPEDAIAEFVDPSLRRVRSDDTAPARDADVPGPQAELFAALGRMHGIHASFQPPPLPPETEGTDFLLAKGELAALKRHADALEETVNDVFESRTFRLMAPVRRLAARLKG